MRWRRLTLLLTVCVTLDLSSPFIAGAFRFEADESIEGVSAHSERLRRAPSPVPDSQPPRVLTAARRPPGAFRLERYAHVEWVVDLRLSHAPASRPPSLTEDH